jgi:hypothetical protein
MVVFALRNSSSSSFCRRSIPVGSAWAGSKAPHFGKEKPVCDFLFGVRCFFDLYKEANSQSHATDQAGTGLYQESQIRDASDLLVGFKLWLSPLPPVFNYTQ